MKKLDFLIIICTMIASLGGSSAYAGKYDDPAINFTDTTNKRAFTLNAHKTPKGSSLDWSIQPAEEVKAVNIQVSDDGEKFTTVTTLPSSTSSYMHDWNAGRSSAYYRLEILWATGATSYTSNVFTSSTVYPSSIVLLTNPIAALVKLKVSNNVPQIFTAEWRNSQGSFIQSQTFKASAGINNIQLTPPAEVTTGTYYLRVVSDDKKVRQLFRVVKQ